MTVQVNNKIKSEKEKRDMTIQLLNNNYNNNNNDIGNLKFVWKM